MNKDYIFIDRWNITKADFIPSNNGDTVLISAKSFGPLEVYEWGLDKNQVPYKLYNWLEDDFFENDNYRVSITKDELMSRIQYFISIFESNGRMDWVDYYKEILEKLNCII
ncbi:hypothetical protein [Absiella sp. AM29-15]|uniref:hypothetical protein n=1 Tax=Absiella sp. AM29-15 TaxID=2292278 RepID=UPI000E40F5A8|nr:hypothetical protein [Absiella sp. AM29-15]RGC53818.1 hypothetical protein DW761_00800 [Absiella sp. AM29-15]